MNGEIVPFASAPRGERELVIAALPARLQELTAATELAPVDLDALDADALFQLGVKAFQSSTVRMAYAGHCWALAKERAGGGRSWIEARAAEAEISARHIYNAITVLEQFVRAPDGLVQPFARLDYTKVLLLKKLDDGELEELAERGETTSGVHLADIEDLSVRDLGKLLTRASHAERHLRDKLDAANKAIEEANAEITELREHLDWDGQLPGSVRQARADGPALSQFALDAVTTIEALFNAVVAGTDLHSDEPRRHGELRSALAPLYVSLHAITAQAVTVERHMREVAGDFLPETNVDLMLSEQECATAAERYGFMRALFERLPSRMLGVGGGHSMASGKRKAGKAKQGSRNG